MRVVPSLGVLVLSGCLAGPAAAWTFPDSHDPVPKNWTGPTFRLSQDYPDLDPSKARPAPTYPWQSIDFRTQPAAYIKAIYDYVLAGNREVDWVVQNNKVRTWYHTPWMHSGDNGREFVRGLTRERTSPMPATPGTGELGPNQTTCAQNWAVGFLNDNGGYITGQVWANPYAPDATKSLFPEGTVAAKLLFTAATVEQAPYLADSLEWDANIEDLVPDTKCTKTKGRMVQKVRLLQMDLAVRDKRADGSTGWVFGTYSYDGTRSSFLDRIPIVGSDSGWWNRMVPVGLMWGNDPTLTQAAYNSGARVKESWINPDNKTVYHVGLNGRLNGPVDNPASACLSCHGTAETPARSAMVPKPDDPNIMHWFQNLPAGNAFDQRSISTDYNLQISTGIQRFREWYQAQAGFSAPPPPSGPAPAAAAVSIPSAPVTAEQETLVINKETVFKITR